MQEKISSGGGGVLILKIHPWSSDMRSRNDRMELAEMPIAETVYNFFLYNLVGNGGWLCFCVLQESLSFVGCLSFSNICPQDLKARSHVPETAVLPYRLFYRVSQWQYNLDEYICTIWSSTIYG